MKRIIKKDKTKTALDMFKAELDGCVATIQHAVLMYDYYIQHHSDNCERDMQAGYKAIKEFYKKLDSID